MKHQLFADYLGLLESLQRRLHKDVQDLPAEAMGWLPGPEMNSVAVQMAHITGVLHEGIDIALGDPPGRVRAQEFQTRDVVSAEMLRRLDAVIDYARDALPRLGLEDLDKERDDDDAQPAQRGVTRQEIARHAEQCEKSSNGGQVHVRDPAGFSLLPVDTGQHAHNPQNETHQQ